MEVRSLSQGIGAEVLGVDLREPQSDASRAALTDALLDNVVLVIRDQELTASQFRAGMLLFGDPMRQHREKYNLDECPDVSIVTNRGGFGKADMWHTDHTNHLEPPKITALHAVVLPSSGGSTWFANMYAAFDVLDEDERGRLRELETVNDMEASLSYSEADRARHAGGIRHPLVRKHPETGREALYFHVTKSQGIPGFEEDAVRPFLEDLLERTVRPEFVYKHTWRTGDIVLVDNRCAMHRAEHDYPPGEHRLLWRVILKGDRPH
ncbi:MAG: TauD/TfdA family dioxygenase [Pseudomonadota bacterium]